MEINSNELSPRECYFPGTFEKLSESYLITQKLPQNLPVIGRSRNLNIVLISKNEERHLCCHAEKLLINEDWLLLYNRNSKAGQIEKVGKMKQAEKTEKIEKSG